VVRQPSIPTRPDGDADRRRRSGRGGCALSAGDRARGARGARIWATHHRLRLAETLLAAGAGDEDAPKLLERVAADAPSFGLNRLAEHAAAVLDGLVISD
jgi:hypothetical protein